MTDPRHWELLLLLAFVAEDAARRLAVSLARVSRPRDVVVIRAAGATLEWATVRTEEGGES